MVGFRQHVWSAAVVGALVAWAGSAQASPIQAGDTVKLADGPGTTGGGEFLMTVNGDSASTFITFCLQRTEYIDFTNTFKVDAVSTFATSDPTANGGEVGTGHDPISQQTAYLYTQFRAGTLTGFDYGAGVVTSANNLQNAIWMFEQEVAMNAANPFVILANNAVTGGAWSGIGNVRALNLSKNGVEAQDQLALVPEPSAALLLMFGVALIAAFRARTSSQLS